MQNDKTLSESQIRVMMALEEADDVITYEELADLSGCSYDGVRGRVSELKKLGFNIQSLKEDGQTVLKYEHTPKKSKFRELTKPRTYGDIVSAKLKGTDDFYGMIDFLNNVKKYTTIRAKSIRKAGDRMGVLILSDLHFGALVKENGKVVYNTASAIKRMNILADKVVDNCIGEGLDELYIAIIGDTIEGDMIYRNQMFYVEKPAIEQIQDATKSIVSLIKKIDEAGIGVTVGCVRGNHGITNYKNLECDNWDNVVYDMLSIAFADDPYVVINHFQDDQTKISLLDKQIVMYHGEALGEQCKTAAGLKSFRGFCGKHRLKDGDIVFVGHLHTFGVESDQCKFLIRNGALTDVSDYALKLNLYDAPSQTMLVIEEGKMIPDIFPIVLNE